MGAWFSEFHSAYAREIERLIVGQTIEAEHGPGSFTISRVKNVVVGIDSNGIFAAINVYDEDGYAWSLYNDGTVCEYDTDREVGRHNLKTQPILPEPVSLADEAKATAQALHLAQFGDAA